MRKLLLAALVAASTLFGPKVFADPIVLYASASVDEISTVVEGFKEQHPNIAVSVVHDGTGSLMRRMLYNYIASRAGNERLLKANYRRPVREDIDVASMSPLPNLSENKPIRVDETQAAIDYSGLLAAWKKRQER